MGGQVVMVGRWTLDAGMQYCKWHYSMNLILINLPHNIDLILSYVIETFDLEIVY